MLKALIGISLLFLMLGDRDVERHVSAQSVVIEDFEAYDVGGWPDRWKFIKSANNVVPASELADGNRSFKVQREGSRKFLRGETQDRAIRISLREGVDFDWNLNRHPDIEWDWRGIHLPAGAREDQRSRNDVAAGVYLTFGSDWLGRPISIKYTYSTTLPVGTVLRQGPLRVMVISSGKEGNTGSWKTIRRNVVNDYRQVFGEDPPNAPISITLWTDSDSVHDKSIADFDNFKLHPGR